MFWFCQAKDTYRFRIGLFSACMIRPNCNGPDIVKRGFVLGVQRQVLRKERHREAGVGFWYKAFS